MNFFPQIGQVLSFQSIFSVFIAILISISVFVSSLPGKVANSQINRLFALSCQEQDNKLNNVFHFVLLYSGLSVPLLYIFYHNVLSLSIVFCKKVLFFENYCSCLLLSTAALKNSSRSKLCSVSAVFGFPKSFRSHVLTAAFQSFIGFLPTFHPLAV